ncbi:AraC family transcriptional regulator [uncultured Thalassospira sp.]|uniref:AraC family transcriptional regulator n=1 Tax=uncultured Thalassospira sp. TaxID=404382 RepID=UPI0030DC7322
MNQPEPLAEIARIIEGVINEDGQIPTAVDNLFIGRKTQTTQPVHTAQWPCFAMIVQGSKQAIVGTQKMSYGAGDYLVVSLDMPVRSWVVQASPEKPMYGLSLAINHDALKTVMTRIAFDKRHLDKSPGFGIAVHKIPDELLDAVLRLIRLLERPDDVAGLACLIEQEILYHLLRGPFGGDLLQIATAQSPANRIAGAVAWLRENYKQSLRIEDLAKHVGMSTSSLHHHFKTITAMTPMQYQKQLRLREARRLMLVEKQDVGMAGFLVGYDSPSQFSREYSRLFGLSPSRDMAEQLRPVTG